MQRAMPQRCVTRRHSVVDSLGMRTTKNISLTAEQLELVESRVASGRYQNASEVVRAALRLLEEAELEREVRVQQLREQINEGLTALTDGDVHDGTAVMAELRERREKRRAATDGSRGA